MATDTKAISPQTPIKIQLGTLIPVITITALWAGCYVDLRSIGQSHGATLSAISTDIHEMKKSLGTQNGELTDLRARFGGVEGRVNRMESRLERLEIELRRTGK